jgi:hypothetical protein
MAMAMHNFHDTHGRLPTAAVRGRDGSPLLSWRVAILPFMESDNLHKRFRLNEPWDSAHNLQLLSEMPEVYAPPPRKRWKLPPYHTICHVFEGPGAAFEGSQGMRLDKDFPDGTWSTLLVVEAGKPVPWTKPENLTYDPNGPLPDLEGIFSDGFRARFVDASAHWVPKETSEEVIRAAITRNGDEKVWLDT